MGLKVDKFIYNELKKKTEQCLRNYPFYIIAIETPGLGETTRWDIIKSKTNAVNSPTESTAIADEYKSNIVNAIEYVLDKLDKCSKRIIECTYFREDVEQDELLDELLIDKGKYYRLRKKALEKFMIVLGYL